MEVFCYSVRGYYSDTVRSQAPGTHSETVQDYKNVWL